jgi:tetratricopeptide (TPR) repeat protein
MNFRSCLLLALLPAAAARGAGAPDLAQGWGLIERSRPAEAAAFFSGRAGGPGAPREALLGQAVALLVRQPVAESQVDQARAILRSLADRGGDDAGLGACYFLGRVAQYYQAKSDPAEAASWFRRVLAAAPSSDWGQAAVTRLAILEIYAIGLERPAAARVEAAGALLPLCRDDSARSELELVLADAIFHHRLPPAGAIPHLREAERLGRLDPSERADVLVQIGETAAICGEDGLAREYYARFLAEYPLDQRGYAVRTRLAALGASSVGVALKPLGY